MAHDVFISYSHQDKPFADAVCSSLEGDGIRCWIAPRDVLPGADWTESILAALVGCRAVVLVFSTHANQSIQVRREVERAVNKGKIIVPFRVENVLPAGSLEYTLSTTHWLDAITPPLEQHLRTLRSTLRGFFAEVPLAAGDRPATPVSQLASSPSPNVANWNPSLPPLFQLRVVDGPYAGKVFPLSNTRMTVGRSSDCDIPLSEPSLSRTHCALQWDSVQRGFVAIDFRACNPMLINGEVLRDQRLLQVGDALTFGVTVMVFERAK